MSTHYIILECKKCKKDIAVLKGDDRDLKPWVNPFNPVPTEYDYYCIECVPKNRKVRHV